MLVDGEALNTTAGAAALGRALIELLEQAQTASASDLDPGAMVDLMADQGSRMLREGECVITTVAGDRLEVAGASGELAQRLSGLHGPLTGTIAARCIAGRDAVDFDDAASDALMGSVLAGAGLVGGRAIPLTDRSAAAPLGAYLVLSHEHRTFSAAEKESMHAYAALVSLSLLRAEQQRKEAALRRRLALGVDLAVSLNAAIDTDDVVMALPQRATEALDAQRATLFRIEGDAIVAEATYDVDGAHEAGAFRIALSSQPLVQEAIRARNAVQGKLQLDAYPDPIRRALGSVRHSLVLPLVFAGQVLGFLNVHRRRDPRFGEDAIATGKILSSVAAVTLRNAHLYADAQAARESMSEFLDIVAHELRAPLTIVSGYLSMINDGLFGAPSAALRQPLETIDAKLSEAQRLVDELLIAARLDNGALPLRPRKIDLADAVQRAVDRARPRVGLLDARIAVDAPRSPVWASADENHVQRILDNLINNALTYGGRPPEVVVTTANHGTPFISVADRGPGVPPEQRPHIFDRFYRGSESTSGFGLGLYVSRLLAETSRGSLDLDASYAGPGTRFVLRLPSPTTA
jgi:signal transduction histidine kinase